MKHTDQNQDAYLNICPVRKRAEKDLEIIHELTIFESAPDLTEVNEEIEQLRQDKLEMQQLDKLKAEITEHRLKR